MSACASLAGLIYIAYYRSFNPSAGQLRELDVIAAVIIGLNLNLIYGLDWSLGRPVAVVVGILIAWTLWILLRGRSKGEGDTLAA